VIFYVHWLKDFFMRQLFLPLGLFFIFSSCDVNSTNENENVSEDNTISNVENAFDSVLAKELGADDYGMKVYVMAFLKSGPNRSHDSATAANIQRAHLDNITRMAEEGKLVFAGPFMDNFDVKGIYIFDVETIEEARELTATDPAVQSGRLEMELHPFYGSAALKMVNELGKKVAKKPI
jgi:uncharacterized protein YciI